MLTGRMYYKAQEWETGRDELEIQKNGGVCWGRSGHTWMDANVIPAIGSRVLWTRQSVFLASRWTLRTLQTVRAVTLSTYCSFKHRGRLQGFPVFDSSDARHLSSYIHPRHLVGSRTKDVWSLAFRRKGSGFLMPLRDLHSGCFLRNTNKVCRPSDFIAFDSHDTSSNYIQYKWISVDHSSFSTV